MKKPIVNITLSLVLTIFLANDCQRSEDDEAHLADPSVQALVERNSKLVHKTWVLTEATRNDIDATNDFLGLELRMEGDVSYRDINVYGVCTTENSVLIFEPQGNWQYQGGKVMLGLVVSDTAVDYRLNDQNDQLTLELSATEDKNPDQQKFTFTFKNR